MTKRKSISESFGIGDNEIPALKLFLSGDHKPYGEKCPRCWRHRIDIETVGVLTLCNRCYLVMEELFLNGELEEFKAMNNITHEQLKESFPYLNKA